MLLSTCMSGERYQFDTFKQERLNLNNAETIGQTFTDDISSFKLSL